MLYGVEVTGMSDSMLDDASRIAAAALSPPTAGKNPTLVLHTASVHSNLVNPMVSAHVEPIKAWSTAWWDGWAQPHALMHVYQQCNNSGSETFKADWNSVRGPAAAMAATCKRLRWRSDDGRHFRDDVGATLDAMLDPPKVFANAAARSAERLMLDKVASELPFFKPYKSDCVGHSTYAAQNARDGGRRHVMVNLSMYIKPLLAGSKRALNKAPQWTSRCKQYLRSAMTGGQWPQTRKAKLPGFVGDNLCQLCHQSPGTAEHRFCCATTKPREGWTPLDTDAKRFIGTLSSDRADTLQNRAALTVQIPIAQPQIESNGWRWITGPPPCNLEDLTWVIDGSRKYASHWTLTTTGCGVAVLGKHGELVAYATATPPSWVKTSGGAEAWALLLTLKHCVDVPAILTDCLALLHMAKAGPLEAAKGKNTDARIWKLISKHTGGCYRRLQQRLTWMPAHTSAAENGKLKSNGKVLLRLISSPTSWLRRARRTLHCVITLTASSGVQVAR
jgi:hypothetical protein